jgi:predicted ATPase
MRLTQLRIVGYRCLMDVSIPLHPLTVMIGPNGSGKTALLEVFQLLRDAADERLSEALERFGGLNTVLPRVRNGSNRLAIGLTVCAKRKVIKMKSGYAFLQEEIGPVP